MDNITLHGKNFQPYLKEEELTEIVKNLAQKIEKDYENETPVFIGVLNGVFMFFGDLLKYYLAPCEVAFIQMSSYSGTESTGIVYQKMELTKDIRNRHVILVEDIVDTGNTVESLQKYFQETQSPKSVKIASLFLKPEVYKKPFPIDYVGREIPNKFIVGYGLDYDELGRNLPKVYQLAE